MKMSLLRGRPGRSLRAEVVPALLGLCLGWAATFGAPRAFGQSYGDITFFSGSDLHYGGSSSNTTPDQSCDLVSRATLDRMNGLPGRSYPASVGGGTVAPPRGVVLIGDLTDAGNFTNWLAFTNDWGLNGERRLGFPVFEGLGNHDVYPTFPNPVSEGVRARNQLRAGLSNISSNGYHYSWDWDYVHFVCLNVYPGQSPGTHWPDPLSSLDFLVSDLASRVGNTGRPVILLHHFGFDAFSTGTGIIWWTDLERSNYFAAIAGYNVIAVFAGHNHYVDYVPWNGLATFNDGSGGKGTGNFLVVHLAGNRMTVLERTSNDTWGQLWTQTFVVTNGLPRIVAQPQPAVVVQGSALALSAQAFGLSLAYQWFFNNTNALAGATNSTLTLSPARFAEAGAYDLVVTNTSGSVTSQPATVTVVASLGQSTVPVLSLAGDPGTVLDLEQTSGFAPTNIWLPLATVTLTNNPQFFPDLSAVGEPKRFYRAASAPLWLGLNLAPVLSLYGNPGDVFFLEYQDAVDDVGPWLPLATVTLTNSPQPYVDLSAVGQPLRSYRAVGAPSP